MKRLIVLSTLLACGLAFAREAPPKLAAFSCQLSGVRAGLRARGTAEAADRRRLLRQPRDRAPLLRLQLDRPLLRRLPGARREARHVAQAGDAGERERLEGQRPVGSERLPLPAAGAGRFAGDRDARGPSHLSCHQSDSRKMTVLECKGATMLRGDGWQPVRGCAKVKNVLHYAEKNPQILFSCEKKNLKMLLERVT